MMTPLPDVSERDMTAASEQPRRRWLRALLALCYALVCFALGSVFIYLGGLEVEHNVTFFGQPEATVGQPVRWLAVIDLPEGQPVPVKVSLKDAQGQQLSHYETTLTTGKSRRVEHEFELTVPPEASPGMASVTVDLDVEGVFVEPQSFDITIHPMVEEVQPQSRAVMRFGGSAPEITSPLRIDVIPPGGFTAPLVQNRIHVRVLHSATSAPVEGASLELVQTHGDDIEVNRVPAATDRFGLTSFEITPTPRDSDWMLKVKTPTGVEVDRHFTLPVAPSAPLLYPSTHVLTPNTPLALEVRSIQANNDVFLSLIHKDAWLTRHRETKEEERLMVTWAPKGLMPPSTPTELTLQVCFSAYSCEASHARMALLWHPEAISLQDALLSYISRHRQEGRDDGYLAQLENVLKTPADEPTLQRLADVLMTRADTSYVELEPQLDTKPATQSRLDTFRGDIKGQANVVLVLVVLTGALFLITLILSMTLKRQRALDAWRHDVGDDDLALDEVPSGRFSREQLARLVFGIEVTGMILISTAFVWGMFLLFQAL